MKTQLRKIAYMMAGWPLIGRFVRSAVTVIRLIRRGTPQLHYQRQQQLPELLQTLSDLNRRQLESDNDRDNLVKSVPVALRKITRDLVDIREQLENISNSMGQPLNETQERLEHISNTVDHLSGRVEFVCREFSTLSKVSGNV